MAETNDTELSRRDVLKRGAIATGALTVGGSALSGTAAAQCYGSTRFIASPGQPAPQPGHIYRITGGPAQRELRPCHGDSAGPGAGNPPDPPGRTFARYNVVRCNGSGAGFMYFRNELDSSVNAVEVTNVAEVCEPGRGYQVTVCDATCPV